MKRVACFVTSHGLGHATRLCAVISALHALQPTLEFEIYTHAPAWVFAESLRLPYNLHLVAADIGLVQRTPIEEDLPETLRQLEKLLPYSPDLLSSLAQELSSLRCELVLCDIAPLGIAVAEKAGLPSVLVENFRWDWIYAGYLEAAPQLQQAIDYLAPLFDRATVYIQTEPVCAPIARAELTVPPISRAPRLPAHAVRQQLGIPAGMKVVLVTSGLSMEAAFLAEQAQAYPQLFLVTPDDVSTIEHAHNLTRVPRSFYHPDLVSLSDAVVGKAGYSTLAETYYAGGLFAHLSRKRFRESASLADFIQRRMAGFELPDDWQDLSWLEELSQHLHSRTSQPPQHENGAFSVARYLMSYRF